MLIPDIGWYGESVRLGNRRFSMGLFEGLQNLFRGISKGRSDDSDKLPVVSSVGLDESDGTLRFTVADDQMQVDMIWNLLTEQIGECRNQQLPKPLPNPDDLFRPTLIGAWAEDRLVGGAFVMPDLEDSAYYAAAGHGDAAEFLAVRTAMVQGIAVLPECRRMGVGAEIKRHCGLWAAQHGCVLVLSIVTNDAAARMNEKAGYQVLPPLVTLVVEAVDHGRSVTFIGLPFDSDSPACTRWAFGLVGHVDGLAVRVGMGGVAEG
jgi:GNAT superfamily N-acetyltransferase